MILRACFRSWFRNFNGYLRTGVNGINFIDRRTPLRLVAHDRQVRSRPNSPTRRQARGNRVRRAVALQPEGELCGRPCPHRGRRFDSGVIRDLIW